MMDGGVRRGTDVLKALALGAAFVFVGRPFTYAAAVGGRAGVERVVRLLREEIDRDMAMLGVNGCTELGPGLLRRIGAAADAPISSRPVVSKSGEPASVRTPAPVFP